MRLLAPLLALTIAACASSPVPPGHGGAFVQDNDPYLAAAVAEINAARTDPHGYAQRLRALRALYNGNRFERPGDIAVVTREGVTALDEAIAFLERQTPVAPLRRNNPLDRAAAILAREQSENGQTGHIGEGGSTPGDRMRRVGAWAAIGEVLEYGSTRPEDAVRNLIVDDGIADRGHRTTLFNPSYEHIGASCASHPQWRQVCVFDLARGAR